MFWTYEVSIKIGSDNDLVPNRWQAIIWINNGKIGEFKLGLNVFKISLLTPGFRLSQMDLLVVLI